MPDPLITALTATKAVVDLTDKLGILGKVRREVAGQSELAGARLATALAEVAVVFESLNAAVKKYLDLWLADDNPDLRRELRKLEDLASGEHEPELQRAHGSCTKIWNIYNVYLTPVVKRVLRPGDAQTLQHVFRELMDSDSKMVDALTATGVWLTYESQKTLELMQQGHLKEADARVQEAKRRWWPVKTGILERLKRINELEAQFVKLHGIV